MALDDCLESRDGINGVVRLLDHTAQGVRQDRLIERPQFAQRHLAEVNKVCCNLLGSIGH